MAVDYTEVKRLFAEKLANDADGMGRFESAFYHTMKWVYEQGVKDGEDHLAQKGIEDGRTPNS